MVPLSIAVLKATIYLLEDIFDLEFRWCYSMSQAVPFPPYPHSYLLTYVYVRRRDPLEEEGLAVQIYQIV